jgi:hypothetical protein
MINRQPWSRRSSVRSDRTLPRRTVGHNWGSEHADSWVWLHAAGLSEARDAWVELGLARIRVGRVRSPWTAVGPLSLGGSRIALGGLGWRPKVDAWPDGLTCEVPSPEGRLQPSVTTAADATVAVTYTDPAGGVRTVTHAARADVELTLDKPGISDLTLSAGSGVYEYGTSQEIPGITPPTPARRLSRIEKLE